MPPIVLTCAWLAGVYLGSFLHPVPLALGLGLLGCVLGLFASRGRHRWSLLVWAVLFLLLGLGRYWKSVPIFHPGTLAHYNDEGAVTLQGVVDSYPEPRGRRLEFTVSVVAMEGITETVKGRALVRLPRQVGFQYGDLVELTGTPCTPPEYEGFSYRTYLARRGVHTWLSYPKATLLARGQGSPFYRALYWLRQKLAHRIHQTVPNPEAALLCGILLGLERGIPKEVLTAFNTTGTRHIIAISGFNITIIAGILASVGGHLRGRRGRLALVVGGVGLYSLLVGGDAAVVRAAIMGMLYALGTHFRRPAYALTSLFVAALIMTLLNPSVLWDVSFQLSFAATLGLVLLVPPMASWIEPRVARLSIPSLGLDARMLLSELVLVTLAANLATLPISLYYFGRLSLIAPLANLLILGAQPAVMLLGGLATLGGALLLPLGKLLGWLAWLPLTFTVRTVEFMARVPLASLELARPAPLAAGLAIGLYYAALLLAGQLTQERPKAQAEAEPLPSHLDGKLRALLGLLVALGILIGALLWGRSDGKLHVIFLDVGEGDAIFIKGPQGQKVLIDGGSNPDILTAHLGRLLPFWDRTLDLVVLTHPDEDHLGGLIGALERYRVPAVLSSGLECATFSCQRWEELLVERNPQLMVVARGTEIKLGTGLNFKVLHPPEEHLRGTRADDNNNSVVLKLGYGRNSFLFTGDLEEEGERSALSYGASLESTFLKVAHHGGHRSSTPAFLEAVRPQVAIISVGPNRYGHPAPEVLKRLEGAEILRTDEEGCIEVTCDLATCQIRQVR